MTRLSPKRSAILLALAAGAAFGQMEIAPPEPPPAPPPAATLPTVVENPAATRHAPTLRSAQSVLDDLLREKTTTGPAGKSPPSPLAIPATTSATSTAPALEITAGLLREGQSISARSGHLAKDATGHMLFVFDPVAGKPALPPMGIVPSRLLVALEEASDHAARPTKFTIDAQITQYRNKNYLYLTDSDAPPPGPATNPATRPQPQVTPVAPEVPDAVRMREGVSIYSRVGRLVKDEKTGTMLFAFDSDGKKMSDPPLALIPCRYLAVLEDASEMGTKPVKFRISGEVTQYRGKNYLFLKFVQVVRDMNQGIGG